jgi:aryl-alcohol dehydrogenase
LGSVIQGDAVPQMFVPRLLDLFRAGSFPVERLIRHYSLDEIDKAFDDIASGDVIKPVLRISPQKGGQM